MTTKRLRRARTGLLLVLALTASVLASAGATSAAEGGGEQTVAAPGDLPYEWHDFTGDGKSDLVAREAGTGRVYVFRHSGVFNGTATYNAKINVLTGAQNFNWMAVADINGDFIADLTARLTNGNLVVYPGTGAPAGAGTFLAPELLGIGWNGLSNLALSDVDGDGSVDITAMRGNGELVVYPHTGEFDGTNTFAPPVLLGTGWDIMSWIGAGEVTSNDEKPDLLGVRRDNGTLQVYQHKPANDTAGAYFGPVEVGTGWDTVQIVSITDVSGDEFGDIVAKVPNGDLVVYPNSGRFTGNTTFRPAVLVGIGWNGMDLVAA